MSIAHFVRGRKEYAACDPGWKKSDKEREKEKEKERKMKAAAQSAPDQSPPAQVAKPAS
jgi:hypothetical protein